MGEPDKLDVLRGRIDELKSWLNENSQEPQVAQSNLFESRSDTRCNCGYLAALEDALAFLSDETSSLLEIPNAKKESNTDQSVTAGSQNSFALNNSTAAADAPPTDRRIGSRARRQGDRRAVGTSLGRQGRRQTDHMPSK